MLDVSKEEEFALIKSLFERINPGNTGMEVLKRLYPEACEEIIANAAFHLFVDGPGALFDLLANIELFLQEKADNIYGYDWHVLYHIYNWHIQERMLSISKGNIASEFYELENMIKNKEKRSVVLHQLKRVKEYIDGSKSPPDFD